MRLASVPRGLSALCAAVCSALCLLAPVRAGGFEIEDHRLFPATSGTDTLKIISSMDEDVFAPIAASFQAQNPRIGLDYTVATTAEVMRALYDEKQPFDVALSSAMDLQVKLANDGFTQAHRSASTDALPDWARWRDHVFAFTREPATIVVSPAAFEGLKIPQTRQDLITLLRQNEDRFRRRVGTYDIRDSGVAFLFATQDARTSDTFWRLTEVMGDLYPRLYCCSGDMIADVASGRIAVAYNVLGSYARARQLKGDRIAIITPGDFTTVMLRTALIPANAPHADLAGIFIDHLANSSWSTTPTSFGGLFTWDDGWGSQIGGAGEIRLGPGLLVHLDPLKRQRFIQEWEDAILRPEP